MDGEVDWKAKAVWRRILSARGLVGPANMSSEDMDIGWAVVAEITSERT